MGDMRISDVVAATRLSARYWQRRAALGQVPGVSYVQHGLRKTYLFDADTFLRWWEQQKKAVTCQETSGSVAKFGGIASPRTASRTKARFKPDSLSSLKIDLKA
jgi:hypothetical protein